jgi:hypothetical protein
VALPGRPRRSGTAVPSLACASLASRVRKSSITCLSLRRVLFHGLNKYEGL